MRLAIEVAVNGVKAAVDQLASLGKSAEGLGKSFRDGMREGMEQAAKEMSRPREELEKLASAARETLKNRSHVEIDADMENRGRKTGV